MRILVAGIGNIFLGDDAFGVETVRALANVSLPAGVEVKDFGIRGWDLTYALLGPYDAFVLVDAIPRGDKPGTLYLVEPEVDGIAGPPDAHALHPDRVLASARAMGAELKCVRFVGCEPTPFSESELAEGRMGLSAEVAAAIPEAVRMIVALIQSMQSGQTVTREESYV